MDKQMYDRILKGAVDLAEHLLSTANREPIGISWNSTFNDNNKPRVTKNETIYNGVCGILLFFLELYKKTKDQKYLGVITKGLKWVEEYCRNHPSASISLFTGRSSVSYFYIQLYLTTGLSDYLEKALHVEKKNVASIDQLYNHQITDYLNGISGRVLGLIYLHSVSNEHWILQTINDFAEEIFNRAYLEKGGLCWDRSSLSIHGLCGFSHGASGVAKIFLELGNYLENESFFMIADMAFAYESMFYSVEANNWIDLRKMVFTEDDEKSFQSAYVSRDLNFFTKGKDTFNAWCHGAAGVGLTRLRAYEVTKNSKYLKEVELAIAKTIETDVKNKISQSFTLCHGRGGNADLFLESFRVLGKTRYWEYAQKIVLDALDEKDRNGFYCSGTISRRDTSMFVGEAGVGYFFLRTLDPLNVPSILSPKIDKKIEKLNITDQSFLNSSLSDICIRSIEKRYARTIKVLSRLFPEKAQDLLKKITRYQDLNILKRSKELLKACMEETKSEVLQDVFEYEQLIQAVNDSIKGDSLLNYKQTKKTWDIAGYSGLTHDMPTDTQLIMDTDLVICRTKWNWVGFSGKTDFNTIMDTCPGSYSIILIPTIREILEQEVSLFPLLVLQTFKSEKTIEEAVREVMNSLEEETNYFEARNLIIEQIVELIKCGFLLNPAKHPLNQEKEASWFC